MTLLKALGSGLVGACALTLIHQTARGRVPGAPRMDALGMRAIAKTLRAADMDVPRGDRLYDATLAGDIISNSLYYSLVAAGGSRNAWLTSATLGLAAGVGAALLPEPIGLGPQPGERRPQTQLMTVAWYLAGGLAAAATLKLLAPDAND